MANDYTDFGYKEVPLNEKAKLVKGVFSSVAENYDLMNDLMSVGIHRLWKRRLIQVAAACSDDIILDLASGTADVAIGLAKSITDGHIWLTDINEDMLSLGRDKVADAGFINKSSFSVANAQSLPFPDNFCNIVTISFGLRNVTNKALAIQEMYRVLKPGGKMLILEFSQPPSKTFNKIYDLYSFKLLPQIGRIVANDEDSYQYLVESIRKHPNQETLLEIIKNTGFRACDYENLSHGIVAIHCGVK